MEGYRYVTTTLEGFVHQVASRYVASGYRHYIRGHVPRGKDPDAIDRKLLAKYDIPVSKWERYRRRRRHEGCVHYIRFERTFLLLAIPGPHTRFFEEERVRDIEAEPIVVEPYEIRIWRGHANVRLAGGVIKDLRRELLRMAARRRLEELCEAIRSLPFEPYAGVRFQLFELLDEIRRRHRLEDLSASLGAVIPYKRSWVRPFDAAGAGRERNIDRDEASAASKRKGC
jgi:hypothetical protein